MNLLSCLFRRLHFSPPPCDEIRPSRPPAPQLCEAMDAYIGRVIALVLEASQYHGDADSATHASSAQQRRRQLSLPAHALFEAEAVDTDALLQRMREVDIPFNIGHARGALAMRVQQSVAALSPAERERALHVFRRGRLAAAARDAIGTEGPESIGPRVLSLCLDPLEDALVDMACTPAQHEPPGFLHGYARALDQLLHAMGDCPAEADAARLAHLAGLLDAVITAGGAATPGSRPDPYDDLIQLQLLEMEPDAFQRVLRLASAPYNPAGPAALPLRLVAQAKAERRIAARELSKIFHHARDLGSRFGTAGALRIESSNLEQSNYAIERSGRAVGLLSGLLNAARLMERDGAAFVRAVNSMSRLLPRAIAAHLRTPWFKPETAAAFEAAIRTYAALFRQADRWQGTLPPQMLDDCMETLRHELSSMNQIIETVHIGRWNDALSTPRIVDLRPRCVPAGPASEALAQCTDRLTGTLDRVKDTLDRRARELLAARAAATDTIARQLRDPDAAVRSATGPLIARFIADTRVISDVALVTGLQADKAALRQRAQQIVGLISDCGHLLTAEQLQALRLCGGLGIPMAQLCDYAMAVKASLAACTAAPDTARFVGSTRGLANAVIALQHCVLTAQSPDEAASGHRTATHEMALEKLGSIIEEAVRGMGPKQADRMRAMVRHRDFQYCLTAAAEVLDDLKRVLPHLAQWCDLGVVADMEGALRASLTIPRTFAEALTGPSGGKGKARMATAPRRPNSASGAQAIRKLYAAAYGVLVRDVGYQSSIAGINNAEFYALHGALPKQAVLSDYLPKGSVFDQCEKMLLDQRTMTKGSVQIRFPGHVTASRQPESFLVNRQFWLDLHRSRYWIGSFNVDSKTVASARDACVPVRAHNENDLYSDNPYLYRVLAELRQTCGGPPDDRKHRERMSWLSSLLGQAAAAAVTALGARRIIRYGWLGSGLLIKPLGMSKAKYRCIRSPLDRDTVMTTMMLTESPTAIVTPVYKDGSGGGTRPLQGKLSRVLYDLSVNIVGSRPSLERDALVIRYALVSEDADRPMVRASPR